MLAICFCTIGKGRTLPTYKPKEPITGRTLAQFELRAPHLLVPVGRTKQLDLDHFPGCNRYNPASVCAEVSGRANARRLAEAMEADRSYPWERGYDSNSRTIVYATHVDSAQAWVANRIETNAAASRGNLIRWTDPSSGAL